MSKWPSWIKLNWADHRMGFLRFLPKRFCAIALIAGLLVAGLTLSTPSIIRHFQRQQLRSYVNQDLKALEASEQDRFEHLIDALVPEATTLWEMEYDPQTWKEWIEARFKSRKYRSKPFGGWQSWHLWSVQDSHGEERLILFQVSPWDRFPGGSWARVFILDSRGNVLARSGESSTGYRFDIGDASLQWEGENGFPCLKITMSPDSLSAGIVARFAILDDWSIALVRLEDREGRILNSNNDFDFPAVDRSVDEWESLLFSRNRGEVLATLAWIGGNHTSRFWPRTDLEQIRDLRTRPRVRTALQELRVSNDQWVKEAAHAALQEIERTSEVPAAAR